MTSVRKSYISKYVNKEKTIKKKKNGKYSLISEGSFIKNNL